MLACLLITITSIGAYNATIDPYGLYNIVRIKDVNFYKTYGRKIRLRKPTNIWIRKPSVLIMGSSRGGRGLHCEDLTLPNRAYEDCYNASLRGITPYESLRMLEHAYTVNPIEEIVWQVSLGTFLERKKYKDSFDENNFAKPEEGITLKFYQDLLNKFLFSLFSAEAIGDSRHTVFHQDQPYGWFASSVWTYQEDGSWTTRPTTQALNDPAWVASQEKKGWGLAYKNMKKNFANFARAYNKNPKVFDKNYDYLEQQLEFIYSNNINLNVIIPPAHADYLFLLNEESLWPVFESWKTRLVETNERLAKQYNKNPYKIWDFSGFHKHTTEPTWYQLPKNQHMKYYVDVVHFNEDIGGELLQAISNQAYEADWYTLINSNNINNHLEKQRKEKDDYFTKPYYNKLRNKFNKDKKKT